MILVDTSIWIDYLRGASRELTTHLEAGQVAIHPWVIGELACGTLENRQTVLSLMGTMPTVVMADHQDMLTLIDTHQPIGRGIDYVDAHLIASALLNHSMFWTGAKPCAAWRSIWAWPRDSSSARWQSRLRSDQPAQ
ncbi:type II toxin-antitoxin system VapC family toxin [Synechococcus sp. Tobar12-5m-g]|uniref:type II toxin-antitoxin system VapC family toxin n=1 Tax=unclassified Synechococcus TaxID=2626047 RepID=UPI0020CB7755|nr:MULTISPECIES: type II toxin-antitoxin system VapC family toxin [unclassified Synechococcus]MCP9771641.1 type II toxin-antitoxin system VapC family toxin [Synechococcus sp. Tobar12-5m-g]MCP9872582.1 type II toxin-antitoxin system VapC family toxin [Synechococcus sp. Cruz CV-v-12]